jgi:preprotein translocase subunit SecG
MTLLYSLAIAFFLFVSVLLCLVVLIQEGRGGGLGASFGGEPSDSLFGTSTPEVLKQVTACLAGIFILSCIILSCWTASIHRHHAAPDEGETELVQ